RQALRAGLRDPGQRRQPDHRRVDRRPPERDRGAGRLRYRERRHRAAEPHVRAVSRLAVLACAIVLASSAAAQGARIPSDAVDAFHAALRNKDTAGALSLLDRGLVVYEFGAVDPTAESYAFRHLPFDMDLAVATRWKLETRR